MRRQSRAQPEFRVRQQTFVAREDFGKRGYRVRMVAHCRFLFRWRRAMLLKRASFQRRVQTRIMRHGWSAVNNAPWFRPLAGSGAGSRAPMIFP